MIISKSKFNGIIRLFGAEKNINQDMLFEENEISFEDKNLFKAFFVSGGFAEVNPEKCIVLAESVDEINTIEKTSIEKEIEELTGQETDAAKEQLAIAKAKIVALESSFYEKI